MGRQLLTLGAVTALILTGCSQSRESSSVEVTPPPVVEVPTQTIFHQAIQTVLGNEAIISTGPPAIEALNSAAAEIAQYAPKPAECAGTIDPEFYTTTEVAMGFHSQSDDDAQHSAQTIVAADLETAEDASAYFTARTEPWVECPSVDLTIDDTNVLTLQYEASTFADSSDLSVPELMTQADQDMVLSSAGELSADFESSDTTVPNPGGLPDYVISPDEIPEPEPESIAVTNATVVARFDAHVYWVTVEPGERVDEAMTMLAEVVETVQAEL